MLTITPEDIPTIVSAQVPLSLREQIEQRAEREGTTISREIREALIRDFQKEDEQR